MATKKSISERFWPKVDKTEGCWLWTGAKTRFGYGWFSTAWPKTDLAHRVAFRLWWGREPGPTLCHTCDVPACVNPAHLYEGTMADNVRDMLERGRHYWASLTHCLAGHPLTPENTYVYSGRGGAERQCRTCAHKVKTASAARRKAARQAAGLCFKCDEPLATSLYCEAHREEARQRMARYKARLHGSVQDDEHANDR